LTDANFGKQVDSSSSIMRSCTHMYELWNNRLPFLSTDQRFFVEYLVV